MCSHLSAFPHLARKKEFSIMESNFSGGGESKSSQQQQPCLLITDGEKNCGIQSNMFNNKPQLLYDVGGEFPEFLGRDIGCSFGEWVLLTGASGDILVNLLSKEMIELPALDFLYDFCVLTSHPYDPTCRIVYFTREENALMFCQPGDKEFTIKRWDYEFFPSGAHAVVGGKVFVSIHNPSSSFLSVGVIEFIKESLEVVVSVLVSGSYQLSFSNCYYCEHSGELFVVCKIGGRANLEYVIGYEIFQADFLNKKLVSVKNLGGVAIFIGYGTAHMQCASVESGIKANSVYFLDWKDPDNYYIYSLKEGSIRMKPIFSSSMEIETTEDTQLDWIMMPCEVSFPNLLKGDQADSEKENKASTVEVEEVGVQNSWNTVPPELLNLIQFQGKFGRDHAVFGAVCKAWQRASIRDYSISPLLSSTTLLELCQGSSPLLMFQEDITISCDSVPIFRFFDPVHRKLYRTGIPELRGTDIHYSKDGWLLVSRRSDESIFFFNPLTQEKIELPPMPSNSFFSAKECSLSFSSLPTCSNCLAVVIAKYATCIYTLKRGDETWRRQGMGEFWGQYVCCPVILNGLLHFMRRNRDMLVFNLKHEDEGRSSYRQTWPTKFKVPQLRAVLDYFLKDYFLEDYFLEIDGGVAIVSVEPDGGEISIFKWNDYTRGWKLMEGGLDFRGKGMFLSRRGSFMEKIDDDVGGLGNAIFLPIIDDAKEGVFYSLATHKYHTLYSGYSSELPSNVDKFLNGIWVIPDRNIVGENNLKWFM